MNKKGLIHGIMVLAGVVFCMSCSNPAKKILIENIDSINTSAPVEVGSLGSVDSVTYNEKEDLVQIYFKVDQSLAKYIVKEDNEQILQNEFRLFSISEPVQNLLNAIMQSKATLNMIFCSPSSDKTALLVMTDQQLASIKNDYLSESQLTLLKLDNEVAILDSRCPEPSTIEGVMIQKVEKKDNAVDFYYVVNENITKLSVLEKKKDELREQFRRMFNENKNDPNQRDFFQMLLDTDYSINIIFCCEGSEDTFNIEFTPQELYALALK